MHKIREVLRLHYEGKLTYTQIQRAVDVSKGAISNYISLSKAQGLSWPLPEEMDDEALERRLFAKEKKRPSDRVEPDYPALHQELKRKGVTLQLLWSEYVTTHGDQAYRYSHFCDRYRKWAGNQKRSMRQHHKAGEKLFIDYCGPTIEVIDGSTGEVRQAQVFVAVFGASNYTFAEATWSQGLPDWIESHQRALRFFGGVPELLVPDNLKSGINKACRYDPEPNSTYQEMARHYGTAILPARPYKPKDKAKAETGVLIVERWIMARLRHHTFFSLYELNQAIAKLLGDLNTRSFQKLPGNRLSSFESLDKPALKALPDTPYDYAEWKQAKVGIDYHIEAAKHYYTVPHALVGQRLTIRLGGTTITVFQKNKQVALHPRAVKGGFTTLPEHMPKSHREHRQWSPGRFMNWAKSIGPSALEVIKRQLTDRPHPEHGYRACLGLLNLTKRYTPPRFEVACDQALKIGSPSYRSIKSILEKGLDREREEDAPVQQELPLHGNVRGSGYYH